MHKQVILAFPAAVFVASVAVAAPSSTQPAQPTAQPSMSTPSTTATKYDDATLIKFAKATKAARKVRMEYKQKTSSTSTQTTQGQLQRQEKKDMGAAISQYMPVSEYESILKDVRHDPQLKTRIKKLVEGRRSQAASAGTSH